MKKKIMIGLAMVVASSCFAGQSIYNTTQRDQILSGAITNGGIGTISNLTVTGDIEVIDGANTNYPVLTSTNDDTVLTYATAEIEKHLDGVFGEIYCNSNSALQAIASGVTYTKVTNFNANGESSHMTVDHTANTITATEVGLYFIVASMSFEGDTANQNWFGSVFVDGVELSEIHFERRVGTNADHGSTAISGLRSITSVPVDIDVRLRHSNGTSEDVRMTYANLTVFRVGL